MDWYVAQWRDEVFLTLVDRPNSDELHIDFAVSLPSDALKRVSQNPKQRVPVVQRGTTPRFRCVADSPSALVLIRVDSTRPADILTVECSTGNDRERVLAVLLGRLVCAGSCVTTKSVACSVVGAETEGGHRTGFFVVTAATRVKINVRPDRQLVPTNVLGVEGEAKRVAQFVAAGGGRWMLLSGTRGCGMSSCLHSVSTPVVRSPAEVSGQPSRDGSASAVVVLLIDYDDHQFPPDSATHSTLSKRLIACRVRQHLRSSDDYVVVVMFTGIPSDTVRSLFDEEVSFALPDNDRRERVLTARFPACSTAEMRELIACTVGFTRSQLLELSRDELLAKRTAFASPMRFDRIGGLGGVKTTLNMKLLEPRRKQDAYRRLGLAPSRGLLLYGPPGCAKTSLVRAICSEQCLTFLYLDSAELMSAYVGQSELTLRETFARAATQAPCVVFFDEVDIIGSRRGAGAAEYEGRLLATLLMELDGFAQTTDVTFIAATNRPQDLDPALIRPGRLDQLVYVPLPSALERRELLEIYLMTDLSRAPQQSLVELIVRHTEGLSGADLLTICKVAVGSAAASCASPTDKTTMLEVPLECVWGAVQKHRFVSYDLSGIEAFRSQLCCASEHEHQGR